MTGSGNAKDEVSRIANLGKLEFSEEELQKFVPGFQQILSYFELLETVPTEDVEPMYQALLDDGEGTPWREDVRSESLPAEDATGNAPDRKDQQFRVPKVIE